MRKLIVGDKLYREYTLSSNVNFEFATVEKITKTQAVLSNGVRLINEPKKDYYTEETIYQVFGDRWESYSFQNDEVVKRAEQERYKQKVNRWLREEKLTQEEKILVYETIQKSRANVPTTKKQ